MNRPELQQVLREFIEADAPMRLTFIRCLIKLGPVEDPEAELNRQMLLFLVGLLDDDDDEEERVH